MRCSGKMNSQIYILSGTHSTDMASLKYSCEMIHMYMRRVWLEGLLHFSIYTQMNAYRSILK